MEAIERSREWFDGQIGECALELSKARRHMEEARIKMLRATDEYNAAYNTIETLEEKCRGLFGELCALPRNDPERIRRAILERKKEREDLMPKEAEERPA